MSVALRLGTWGSTADEVWRLRQLGLFLAAGPLLGILVDCYGDQSRVRGGVSVRGPVSLVP